MDKSQSSKSQSWIEPSKIIQKACYTREEKKAALESVILIDQILVPRLREIKIELERSSRRPNWNNGIGSAITGVVLTSVSLVTKAIWGSIAIGKKTREDLEEVIKIRETELGKHVEAVPSLESILNHLINVQHLNKEESLRWVLGFIQICPGIPDLNDIREIVKIIDFCMGKYGRQLTYDALRVIRGVVVTCLSQGLQLAFETFKEITSQMGQMVLAYSTAFPFALMDMVGFIDEWIKGPNVVESISEYIDHLEQEIGELKEEIENIGDGRIRFDY